MVAPQVRYDVVSLHRPDATLQLCSSCAAVATYCGRVDRLKSRGVTHVCSSVAPIDHVYNTLGMVKASSTQRYADISKLRPEVEGSGSFTFFAPSNEAWESLDEVPRDGNKKPNVACVCLCVSEVLTLGLFQETRNALVSNVNIELYNALHYHMVNQRLMTRDLKNNRKVTSMYNDLELQINHYPNGVRTSVSLAVKNISNDFRC